MTTVVITEDHIAHDARGSSGSGMIISDSIGKSIGYKGDVYVCIGNAGVALAIMYLMVTGKPHPRWKLDGSGFVVVSRKDGTVETLSISQGKNGIALECSPVVATRMAFGSGGPWATAALDMGKNVREAIEYAKTRDTYTGGTITVLPRRRTEDIEDYNLECVVGGAMRTLLDITGEDHDDLSLESFFADYQSNVLFGFSPVAFSKMSKPSRFAGYVAAAGDNVSSVFEDIAARWGFQVTGNIKNLYRTAEKLPYMSWLNYDFYKPQGMNVGYVEYIKALLSTLNSISPLVTTELKKLQQYANHCLGDPRQLLKIDRRLDALDVNPMELRQPLDKVMNRDDPRNRCKVDALVGNNRAWSEVETLFASLTKAFDKLNPNRVLSESTELANTILELADEVKRLGDVDSIVGTENYRELVKRVEILAWLVDTVGVMGYLIQALETSLLHNLDMMDEVV